MRRTLPAVRKATETARCGGDWPNRCSVATSSGGGTISARGRGAAVCSVYMRDHDDRPMRDAPLRATPALPSCAAGAGAKPRMRGCGLPRG
jgi:hypothetical protein